MPQQLDRDYIQARRAHAQEMARTAADPAVARIHQEFAERYALMLDEDEAEPEVRAAVSG